MGGTMLPVVRILPLWWDDLETVPRMNGIQSSLLTRIAVFR
jgi:hypothetical protein